MDAESTETARACLAGAENNTSTFPQIVVALIAAGFESYVVDLRRGRAPYYLPDGESVDLETHAPEPVAAAFDAAAIRTAIKEAQTLAPGYSYLGFCRKVRAAGCAGYIVSFAGRRALYYGRTAESHVEHFPK